jgi:hypothetical protein
VRQLIPLLTGSLTLIGMWRAGSKKADAWLIGLVNQGFWLLTIVVFGVWGLLPLTLALTGIYVRNLLRWRGDG